MNVFVYKGLKSKSPFKINHYYHNYFSKCVKSQQLLNDDSPMANEFLTYYLL